MFYLNLSDNSLSTFASNMFDKSEVSILYAANNSFTKVENGFFSKVQKSSLLIPTTDSMYSMLTDGSFVTFCRRSWGENACKYLFYKTFAWYLILREQFVLEIHKINPMQNLRISQYSQIPALLISRTLPDVSMHQHTQPPKYWQEHGSNDKSLLNNISANTNGKSRT